MTRLVDLDHTLARLSGAAASIAESLLALELDPCRSELATASLRGATAARWAHDNDAVLELWQSYSALEALLDRAARLRGTRARLPAGRLAALRELLQGASFEPAGAAAGLERRELLAGPPRWTPDELLARMVETFDAVKPIAGAIAAARDARLPRVVAAGGALDELADLAAVLGAGRGPQLAELRRRQAALADRVRMDPLSLTDADLDRVEASLAALGCELREADALRREIGPRIDAARELLGRLAGAVADCARAGAELRAKIAGAVVADPPRVDPALARDLDRAGALARHGSWREAQSALDGCTRRAACLLLEAQRSGAANRAPLRERDELRGLLDACAAKARQLGVADEPSPARLLGHARALLHAAPTDLARAARLVERYRRSLPQEQALR